MRRLPIGLVLWLVALATAEVAALWAVWRFFVRTAHGQLLDTIALTGTAIGRARVEDEVGLVLNGISLASLAVATAVVGFIALVRRRFALAAGALLLIGGANVTTQLLKQLIYRPDLGIDPERAGAGNSLPSGHTTVAASVAVALVLVVPTRLRAATAVLGAAATAAVGVTTLSAGWHRPSDAAAAMLVVGGWAGAAALFAVTAQRRHGNARYGRSHGRTTAVLLVGGLLLLGGAALAFTLIDQRLAPPEELSRRRLFLAYAGGALGVAGTAALLFGSVLATVHRVVPQDLPDRDRDRDRDREPAADATAELAAARPD
jgi:membrane-associated phospholipid phosphatase